VPGSATKARVRDSFAEQAQWCDRLGSPFTASLCRVLGRMLDRETPTGRRALDWPGDPAPTADALALRLCGGINALVRSGAVPTLASLYPPAPLPDEESLAGALGPVLARPGLAGWLDLPPQTNEVGRSAVLMAGLLVAAKAIGRPFELLELGASAGLNLVLDRYGYALGGLETGVAGSPLRLAPEWTGPPPPAAEVVVVGRRGVDLSPVDDPSRLLAYVWPDQSRRLEQAEKAIALLADDPPTIDRGDAAEWLEAQLASPAPQGAVRAVIHSVAYQYFPAETQARVTAAIELAGGRGPIAWVRMEKAPDEAGHSLRVRLWPGGEDRLLARVHPHGASVEWLG